MSKPTYQQVHTDVALTNISIAFKPGAYIADQIFPNVPVNKISDKYYIYTQSDWLRDEADQRAPGTRARRGGYGTSTGTYTCKPYAFAKGVEDEIADNADSPLQPLRDATVFVTEKLYLRQEVDVAADVFGTGWSSSATPTTLWSNDTANILVNAETGVNTIASTIFREPNVGVIGRGLWRYVKTNPEILDRIKGAAGPGSPAIVTVNAVAALIGLEKLLIGGAGKDTGNEGASASRSFVWGNHMFIGYVAANASLMNPSAGYIFSYKKQVVERFREDQEHQDVVSCEAHWDTAVTASDAGYLIKSAA